MHLQVNETKELVLPDESSQGFSALLLGDAGSGKTHSIASLAEAGLEVFCLFTEPGSWGVLKDAIRQKRLDINKFHYNYVAPVTADWKALIDVAKIVNTQSQATQQKMEGDRRKYNQWVHFLEHFQNFTDLRTKTEYGDVTEWGDDRVLVLDSLSGANIMAMDLVVGNRPILAPADWQTTQKMITGLLNKILTDRFCHFVMTGHIIRQENAETGGVEKLVNAPGKAIAPAIPRFFDNVILASSVSGKFNWSTDEHNIQLKSRHLGVKKGMTPSFLPIYTKWKELRDMDKSEV